MLSLSRGGLPVSAPFPAVSVGLGPALSPQIIPVVQGQSLLEEGQGSCGDMHQASAEGTSWYRGALGRCSGEEIGPGTVLHATVATPSSQETLMPFSSQEVFLPLRGVRALQRTSLETCWLQPESSAFTLCSQAQLREWCSRTSNEKDLV